MGSSSLSCDDHPRNMRWEYDPPSPFSIRVPSLTSFHKPSSLVRGKDISDHWRNWRASPSFLSVGCWPLQNPHKICQNMLAEYP